MRLVYKESRELVKVGDLVTVESSIYCVTHFAFPRNNPNSSGKVSVKDYSSATNPSVSMMERELYTHVLGMEWIERGLPETSEQTRALQVVANAEGPDWREVLAYAWMNGREARWDSLLAGEGLESCYLRQVRNRLGPAWLYNECSIEAVLR